MVAHEFSYSTKDNSNRVDSSQCSNGGPSHVGGRNNNHYSNGITSGHNVNNNYLNGLGNGHGIYKQNGKINPTNNGYNGYYSHVTKYIANHTGPRKLYPDVFRLTLPKCLCWFLDPRKTLFSRRRKGDNVNILLRVFSLVLIVCSLGELLFSTSKTSVKKKRNLFSSYKFAEPLLDVMHIPCNSASELYNSRRFIHPAYVPTHIMLYGERSALMDAVQNLVNSQHYKHNNTKTFYLSHTSHRVVSDKINHTNSQIRVQDRRNINNMYMDLQSQCSSQDFNHLFDTIFNQKKRNAKNRTCVRGVIFEIHIVFSSDQFASFMPAKYVGFQLWCYNSLLESISKALDYRDRIQIYVHLSNSNAKQKQGNMVQNQYEWNSSIKNVANQSSNRKCDISLYYLNYADVFLKTVNMYANTYQNLHKLKINYIVH